MLHDHPARGQVVTMGNIEEMDVQLSVHELREFFGAGQARHLTQLLGGPYILEPWIRVRMADDWIVTTGIEVTREEDES